MAHRRATDADHAVVRANTTQDISVADQDQGTATTTTSTTTVVPAATANAGITAVTATSTAATPSSLSDTTVPETANVPFRSQ